MPKPSRPILPKAPSAPYPFAQRSALGFTCSARRRTATSASTAGPAIEFNRPGLEAQLPGYLSNIEQRIAKAEAVTPAPPELPRLKKALEVTGDVPAANNAFDIQLVDWFLHRVYDELAGPLTDAIAPIPAK